MSPQPPVTRAQPRFTGCGTALITPFRADQSLDEVALRRLVRRQIPAGINFLVPCGTTGESPTLTREEHLRIVEITLEEAQGRVPVLGGAGGYNTREVIGLARELERLGVDGILSVTPYYNKPTQEGLYQHYKAIADAVPLPIIVYSVQGRTGVNVEPATLARLAGIPNIVGVKEASGNITQMANVIHQVPPEFVVLSGDDAITLPLMALGGRGIISVASNEIPAEMTQLAQLCLAGDFAAARALQRKYLPLMEVNFVESNPIPVKAALALMGLLEPVYRLPMVPPKEENLTRIEKVLESVGLLGRVTVAG
jgi:4-hydroxy-tetrahydrodipicolinate synthase